jgi:hypothetical protein
MDLSQLLQSPYAFYLRCSRMARQSQFEVATLQSIVTMRCECAFFNIIIRYTWSCILLAARLPERHRQRYCVSGDCETATTV